MSSSAKGYAASSSTDALTLIKFKLKDLLPDEVEIAIDHCGLCGTDLSYIKDKFQITEYPFIGGHEIVGRVVKLGSNVTDLSLGQKVGIGFYRGFCNSCSFCNSGNENLCSSKESTIASYGGFSDKIRVQGKACIKIPNTMNYKDVSPLLCAGITVYSPLVEYNVSQSSKVAVIGIGGLGHIAVMFLKKWGCEVTAFTSTESKKADALQFGADRAIGTYDTDEKSHFKEYFDLIFNTIEEDLNWNELLNLLKPNGRLHFLGLPKNKISFDIINLLRFQKTISASIVGSPSRISKMLNFASKNGISPETEHFHFSDINKAITRLKEGKVRYRAVLSWNT